MSTETDTDTDKRPAFGNRHLTDEKNVFEHNAWDNVVWDEEQEEEARRKTEEQLREALGAEKQAELEENADEYWDKFYGEHQNRFFKDRHWLFTEFPELAPRGCRYGDVSVSGNNTGTDQTVCKLTGSETKQSSKVCDSGHVGENLTAVEGVQRPQEETAIGARAFESTQPDPVAEAFPGEKATTRIWEVGCGVGNTVFPVLQTNNDPGLMVYCCDFSSTAVNLVKEHADYNPRRCTAFVCDIADENSSIPFPPGSQDVIILIFVLSAIHPDKMQFVISRLASYLKPGGKLLFRDYGRYDMAQLRFKKGRCLSENFYVRGDGTRVYFFTQDEVRDLCSRADLQETQNLVDRRLQVNRGRQLKMYRVWIQAKYTKPSAPPADDSSNSSVAESETVGVSPTR